MRRRRAVRAAIAALLLAACGGGKREDPCSPANLKADTARLAASWYLYPELLPASIDLDAYQGPADLLDALTASARAAGKDRFWSYTTTLAAQQQFFQEGTAVGFGLGILLREDGSGVRHLLITQVYPGSAAAAAGFLRGDEIVAIGEAEPLASVATLAAGGTLDEASAAVGNAFGPATAGLPRLVDVVPRGGSAPVRRAMTKGTFSLDPVPAPQVIPRAGGLTPAGYVALRTFITPAEPLLASAFETFQAAGVKDVIVDLRYNGGGLLATADVLGNLLGAGLGGSTMFELRYNAAHAGSSFADIFDPPAAAMAPERVAFLVTGASASASELVPNALAPYRSIALVGHQTYGKPVGQAVFTESQCGLVVNLISFRLTNADGVGDYFGGLPYAGFRGCAVAADDDLAHLPGAADEAQTAAALDWLASGTCPSAAGPLSAARAEAASRDAYPDAVRPSDAQRHVRGLF